MYSLSLSLSILAFTSCFNNPYGLTILSTGKNEGNNIVSVTLIKNLFRYTY